MRRDRVIMLFVCAISIAAAASAQDNPRVGLAMGYPAAVALVWHPIQAVGIRPEFSIAGTTSTTNSQVLNPPTQLTNSTSGLSMTIGVAALFYTASHDNLRVFVSPAFTFQRVTSSSSFTNGSAPPAHIYGTRGSLGAEYAVSRRFSAFGEVGMVYAHQRSVTPGGTSSASAWSLRSGVGVILYF